MIKYDTELSTNLSRFKNPLTLSIFVNLIPPPQANEKSP